MDSEEVVSRRARLKERLL